MDKYTCTVEQFDASQQRLADELDAIAAMPETYVAECGCGTRYETVRLYAMPIRCEHRECRRVLWPYNTNRN